jgi:CheY-like chemotaxis protein
MEELKRQSFDLIISDLHMPRRSGLEFLRSVKGDAVLCAIPFLFFSSSFPAPGDEVRELAISIGAKKVLTRPIDPEKLLSEIQVCLAIIPQGSTTMEVND